MRRLARLSFLHRRLVLGAWLAALVAVLAALLSVGAAYDDEFSLPDTESSRALLLLQRVSPTASGDTLTAVAAVSSGRITDPGPRERFAAALAELEARPEVAAVASPYAPGGERQVSADGRTAFATVTLAGLVPNDVTNEQVRDLLEDVGAREGGGVQLEITGSAASGPPEQGLGEVVGLAAAAVVLFWVFGSLVAMSLPLISAVLSIAVSVGAVSLLTNLFTVATFAPTLSVLLGLGVGIDYALFIVTRYRTALLEGASPEEATVTALDTSGRAVLFAGITVCIALLGLFALGLSFLYGVAVAASLAVATTVLASLTLLPALLGFFGLRVLPQRERAQLGRRQSARLGATPAGPAGPACSTAARRCSPVLSLARHARHRRPVHLAPARADRPGQRPGGLDDPRRATTCSPAGFGPGFNGPLVLVTDLGATRRPRSDRAPGGLGRRRPDVAAVTPTVWLGGPVPGTPAAGGVGITTVYPASAPQDVETDRPRRQRLRGTLVPQAVGGTGQAAARRRRDRGVPGLQRRHRRPAARLRRGRRAAVVPAAHRGVPQPGRRGDGGADEPAVGRRRLRRGRRGLPARLGHRARRGRPDRADPGLPAGHPVRDPVRPVDGLRGVPAQPGPRGVAAPGDNRHAVLHGLAVTGRTITAAAAIMVMLFLAFVLGPDLIIKLFGLGLAAAVLLDALVVRSVLVPALMLVLGRSNWYLPKALDRVLPRLSVEGPAPEPVPAPQQAA